MAGDPTFFGWLTTGAYVAAASLCACAAFAASAVSQRTDRRQRLFWLALATALVLLAINKQLDVQTAMTNALRDAAERGDWYPRRRMLQAIAVIVGGVAASGVLCLLVRSFPHSTQGRRLTLAGLALVTVFLLLRFADIERIDQWLGVSMAATSVRAVIEWLGLILLSVGAWLAAVGGDGRFDGRIRP